MIEFAKKAVEEAADEYKKNEPKKVNLPKEYRELMNNVSRVMASYIPMSDGAIRGFISRAIIKWQEDHNKEISQVLSMSLIERQQMMKEGMEILKGILGNILKTPSDQAKLDEAINKGYNAYLREFMPKK